MDATAIPEMDETTACVESNAAALALVKADERFLIYYRKGYCELFGALSTEASRGFQAAAQDFTETIANWPKKAGATPPRGLRGLIAIAHIEQGRMADSYPDIERDLSQVVNNPGCSPTPLMAVSFCNAVVDTARTWLGWLSYIKNDFPKAAFLLEPLLQRSPPTPWATWIAGRMAQRTKDQAAQAAALYEQTLERWSAAEKSRNPDVVTMLGPKLDTSSVHYHLGLADYSRQLYDAAVKQFDACLKESPKNSYAIFLRGRAKEALKLDGAAVEDYAQAAQMAHENNDAGWNVGQAHYYRGVLLFRSKDFLRAESEFSNALKSRLGDIPPQDAAAWKALAAVSGSGCRLSVDQLEAAANAATSNFPKASAAGVIFDCRARQATTLEQLLALEKLYRSPLNSWRLDAARMRDLRNRIANSYADRGVAAEDRKDPYAAVAEYRHAIEWDAVSSKARFNLGAIYIEDKRYDLAEAEYRALTEADAKDYEAKYWLAESILTQRPNAVRKTEACKLLAASTAIADGEKKAQFAKALAAAKCPN